MSSDSDTRRIGKAMIWAGWIVFLSLFTVFFNNMLSKHLNPNINVFARVSEEGVKEVELVSNRSGHYVTPGFINGHSVVFLIDTGASDVAIPEKVARRIGLSSNQPIVYQTANGTVKGYLTNLASVSIGNIQLNDIRGGINPSMKDEQILLGMSFLKHLEFTQRDKQLIIRQYPGDN